MEKDLIEKVKVKLVSEALLSLNGTQSLAQTEASIKFLNELKIKNEYSINCDNVSDSLNTEENPIQHLEEIGDSVEGHQFFDFEENKGAMDSEDMTTMLEHQDDNELTKETDDSYGAITIEDLYDDDEDEMDNINNDIDLLDFSEDEEDIEDYEDIEYGEDTVDEEDLEGDLEENLSSSSNGEDEDYMDFSEDDEEYDLDDMDFSDEDESDEDAFNFLDEDYGEEAFTDNEGVAKESSDIEPIQKSNIQHTPIEYTSDDNDLDSFDFEDEEDDNNYDINLDEEDEIDNIDFADDDIDNLDFEDDEMDNEEDVSLDSVNTSEEENNQQDIEELDEDDFDINDEDLEEYTEEYKGTNTSCDNTLKYSKETSLDGNNTSNNVIMTQEDLDKLIADRIKESLAKLMDSSKSIENTRSIEGEELDRTKVNTEVAKKQVKESSGCTKERCKGTYEHIKESSTRPITISSKVSKPEEIKKNVKESSMTNKERSNLNKGSTHTVKGSSHTCGQENKTRKDINKAKSNSNKQVQKIDYSSLEVDVLWKYVKAFMIKNGVRQEPVKCELVEAKFGAINVVKLVRKNYLLKRGKGYTMGI